MLHFYRLFFSSHLWGFFDSFFFLSFFRCFCWHLVQQRRIMEAIFSQQQWEYSFCIADETKRGISLALSSVSRFNWKYFNWLHAPMERTSAYESGKCFSSRPSNDCWKLSRRNCETCSACASKRSHLFGPFFDRMRSLECCDSQTLFGIYSNEHSFNGWEKESVSVIFPVSRFYGFFPAICAIARECRIFMFLKCFNSFLFCAQRRKIDCWLNDAIACPMPYPNVTNCRKIRISCANWRRSNVKVCNYWR